MAITETSKIMIAVEDFVADIDGQVVMVHKQERLLSSEPVVRAHPLRFRERIELD